MPTRLRVGRRHPRPIANDDARQDQLTRIREAIELETALVEGAKGKFWTALRRKVAEQGLMARSRINDHEKMTNEQRAIWLDRFLRYEWFMSVVERAPRTLDILEQKFAKLKADLEIVGKGGYNG